MDSRTAHNMMKAENQNLKQRAMARERNASNYHISALGELSLNQQDTDYPTTPNLGKMPLKVRERFRATEWPAEQRTDKLISQPESRNLGGTIWRRWPDGRLAIDESIASLESAIMKWNREMVPLNEIETLTLSSVFPEIEFSNMPKAFVEIKARLSPQEKEALRDMTRVWPRKVPKK